MTFPIRGILKLAGNLLRRSWLPLVLVTLVHLLPKLVTQLLQGLVLGEPWRDAFITSNGFGPAAWALIAVSWFLHGFHMSAVTEIALRTAATKPIKPGALILSASVNAIPILLLHTLLEIVIAIGAVFLVVPGLFLGAAFSLVVPVYVCEGKKMVEAWSQSFRLTSGRRLPIGALWFSIILAVGLLTGSLLSVGISLEAVVHQFIPTLSLPPLPSPAPLSPFFTSPLGMMLSILASQAYVVVLMVLNVAIYLGLRFHKGDSANTQIAAIFE